MRVLHIANNDKGGAANAMLTLHESLLSSKIDSKVLVLHKYKKNDLIHAFLQDRKPVQKLKDSIAYRIFNIKRRYHSWFYRTDNNFTYYNAPYDVTNHPLFHWADVVHLHWYHNFVDLPRLVDKNSKQIVLTLHDENLFLGGFHYTFDKNVANHRSLAIDMRYANRKQKLIHNKKNLHFVAPSKWLFSVLEMNGYSKIYHIPYAIHDSKFKHKDKNSARDELGIDYDHTVYLLLADHLYSKRKGVMEAIKAFIQIPPQNAQLLVVGNCDKIISHPDVQYLGYVNNTDELCSIYSAADATVVPTLADNLPNTVLESIACGTPVIGFDTGGMSDMVNRENGVLLDLGNFNGIF